MQTLIFSQYNHVREGEFQFDGLMSHLIKHDAPSVVAIAEDATRIVNRIEYDPATNRCVGFVLLLIKTVLS